MVYRRSIRRRRNRRRIFRPQSLIKTGFPLTTAVKLRYVANVSIDPALSNVGYHHFRANGMWDPDASGLGHQPMGFDQWSLLYNHYIVLGSKIQVFFHGNAGTTPLMFGCVLADDTASTVSAASIIENGTTKYKLTNANANNGTSKAPRVTCCYSAKKFYNLTDVLDNRLMLGASIAADPSELAYFSVFCGPLPDQVVDVATMSMTVIIEYIAVFSEPREQVASA